MKRTIALVAVFAAVAASAQAHDECVKPGLAQRARAAVVAAVQSAGNYVKETRVAGVVKRGYNSAAEIAAQYPKTSKAVAAVAVAGAMYAVYAKLQPKSNAKRRA